MIVIIRWLRLGLSYCLFACAVLLGTNKNDSIYLFYQAKGQLAIVFNTESIDDFALRNTADSTIKQNLDQH